MCQPAEPQKRSYSSCAMPEGETGAHLDSRPMPGPKNPANTQECRSSSHPQPRLSCHPAPAPLRHQACWCCKERHRQLRATSPSPAALLQAWRGFLPPGHVLGHKDTSYGCTPQPGPIPGTSLQKSELSAQLFQ